jgi:hypothetical protein
MGGLLQSVRQRDGLGPLPEVYPMHEMQTSPLPPSPSLLEPIADGDVDLVVEILLTIARRILQGQQAVVHSEDQAA